MKTPKSYSDNLKAGVITDDMLAKCLFSVNKRAKNCRDQERSYREKYRGHRYRYDKYDTEEKYRDKKNEYYGYKDKLLTLVNPICVHREFAGYERIRVEELDPEFHMHRNEFVYESSYYDREIDEFIRFGDYEDKSCPNYRHYLFYEIAGYSFHTPIDVDKLAEYKNLEICDIGNLVTKGLAIEELLSVQFVKKVLNLIESGDYSVRIADCVTV